ncbi:ATP-dependent Clp protease proteolytic subunit [Gracilibacillus boraciitolerans]|uniref:ATP-dependent Clp protease proteolytic subunit n=1 Tax=Gracilibacillus boraciitolerans TaxID=307521 RepID=UPI00130D5F42|nr:ATP-dependent Clp protease proteolytic subunit [Gracilibacillus boraciitolerans]
MTIIVITFIGFTIYRNSNEYIQNGWQESIVEGEGKEKISQIFIDGPIYSNSLQHQNSILNLLNIIAEDSSIKGVVLSVNTPGGDVVAIDNIYNELVKIKEKGGKNW